MSEMYGRLIVYHVGNILFVIFTIGCAASNSMSMLIVFRFLAGSFGATPLTLGGATIADLMPMAKRAKGMSAWVLGPTIGPAIGEYFISPLSALYSNSHRPGSGKPYLKSSKLEVELLDRGNW